MNSQPPIQPGDQSTYGSQMPGAVAPTGIKMPGASAPSGITDAITIDDSPSVDSILQENARRVEKINELFNPFSGQNSTGKRKRVAIRDFPIPVQYLPEPMLQVPLVKWLMRFGLYGTIKRKFHQVTNESVEVLIDMFLRIRYKYDFPFWCWMQVKIHPKGSGENIPFRLNYAQRILVERFEAMRLAGKPIRLVLLKARQWGGSTCTQMYIAWIQLVHLKGAHSIIVGHVKDVSAEVYDMYDTMIKEYPYELMYEPGESFNEKLPKLHGSSRTANIYYVDSRNCKIKIGTAEKPNSARGGDATLAHCTEVALWTATEGKTPEDIVDSVTGGINYDPMTMIVYESTAKGAGNFFHKEYIDAKEAEINGTFFEFERLFINWQEIGWKNMLLFSDNQQYLRSRYMPDGWDTRKCLARLPEFDFYRKDTILDDAPTEREFAAELIAKRKQRDAPDVRHEPGSYLYHLWEMGATLQGIFWYVINRTRFTDHADWAAETPSDDIEAFKFSNQVVFSEFYVEQMRKSCRPPKAVGEIASTLSVSPEDFKRYAHRANDRFRGREILSNLSFFPDPDVGNLSIWEFPETFEDCQVRNRYIVGVDIGGTSNRADYSVVTVLDRYWMIEGGRPAIVAQWYGHIDHDILAWKAAQIAKFYNDALLVIESNTLETRDRDRDVDGDQSQFILNQIKDSYPNLYERTQDEAAILSGAPRMYGFHTNTNTKPMIIAHLQKMLREQAYVERDEKAINEFLVYEKKPNNSFGARVGYHDDLLMARAILLFISFCEMDPPSIYTRTKKSLPRSSNNMVTSATM